jgi:hypothetical protein
MNSHLHWFDLGRAIFKNCKMQKSRASPAFVCYAKKSLRELELKDKPKIPGWLMQP